MKFLLFFAIIVVCAALYYHDKQQTADLAKANAEVAGLNQQLASYQSAFYQLKIQLAAAQESAKHPAPAQFIQNYQSPLKTDHLDGSGPDR